MKVRAVGQPGWWGRGQCADNLQPACAIGAAEEQHAGGVERADDAGDDGFAGEPGAELLPCLHYASPTRDWGAAGAPESGTPA